MVELLQNWLMSLGLGASSADVVTRIVLAVGVVVLSLLADVVARRLLLNLVKRMVARTKTAWDDILLEQKVFTRLAHVAPAIVVIQLNPIVFEGHSAIVQAIDSLANIYMIVVALMVVDALLNGALAIYRTFEVSRRVPIRSFVQVVKIAIFFLGGILVIAILIGESPVVLVAGLGALSAVLLLVFQQPILGFVAGIQLSANKMIQRGDWIEMPKYGADGDVLDVTLTTVKVQNWDKTISYIPSAAFLSDTFRNWRGMSESGGRRIKRAINIDLNTIKFCDEAMLKKFSKIQYIQDYLNRKLKEIAEHNEKNKADVASLVNGRHLTNVGTFRAYVVAYLKHHPMIHQEMTFLVRQLKPTEFGLPIEIYVFSRDQVWANYEAIQADIFDHILASVPEFELRVFQNPSGSDFQQLGAS